MSVPIVVGALALSACGSRKSSSTPNSSSTGANKIVKIALDAPLTGSLAPLGLGMLHSTDLAIKTANSTHEVPGVTFQLVQKDDQATANIGQDNATALVADSSVLGVVGPLNSSVAQSMQSVFNAANLTEVSPANTNPSLTRGANWQTSPARAYQSYFRTCATDDLQGPFAADYVYNTLKITKVAVVNDGKTYGQGLAQTFTQEFTKLGGQIAKTDVVGENDTDFTSVVNDVKPSGAQLLYYGGEYPVAGPLSLQLKNGGANIPVMGGDGIYDPKYIQLSGGKGDGDFATSVGAPTATLDSAKTFIANYAAQNYPDPYAAYGAYTYDAAWSIIEAVKAASAGGATPTRQSVETAMASVSFDGVTGHVSFDKYGDTTNKVLTMYKVSGGQWGPIKTQNFSQS
jgi:branched-chain amino acid transport system substrate-binding protein